MMGSIPGYGILSPGPQPSTSSAVQNYPLRPYNQPPPLQEQRPIPGHGRHNRDGECNQERERERERVSEHDGQFAADSPVD